MSKKIKRSPESIAIAKAILEQYKPETTEDMQDAICTRDPFGRETDAQTNAAEKVTCSGRLTRHLAVELKMSHLRINSTLLIL